MSFSRLKRRERLLAAVTSMAITGALVYATLLEPLGRNWMALRREADASIAKLAELQGLIGSRDRIREAYRRVEESVTTGASPEETQLTLFTEASRIAGECAMEVDSLKPVRAAEESGLDRYGLELSGRCTGQALMDLLLALQAPEHLMRIEKMTVVAGRGKPPLTVTMRVSKLARVERKH